MGRANNPYQQKRHDLRQDLAEFNQILHSFGVDTSMSLTQGELDERLDDITEVISPELELFAQREAEAQHGRAPPFEEAVSSCTLVPPSAERIQEGGELTDMRVLAPLQTGEMKWDDEFKDMPVLERQLPMETPFETGNECVDDSGVTKNRGKWRATKLGRGESRGVEPTKDEDYSTMDNEVDSKDNFIDMEEAIYVASESVDESEEIEVVNMSHDEGSSDSDLTCCEEDDEDNISTEVDDCSSDESLGENAGN